MLPDFIWTIFCSLPLIELALFALAVWYMVKQRRKRRDSEPRCAKCGYLLYGLPSNICPECGTPFEPVQKT